MSMFGRNNNICKQDSSKSTQKNYVLAYCILKLSQLQWFQRAQKLRRKTQSRKSHAEPDERQMSGFITKKFGV